MPCIFLKLCSGQKRDWLTDSQTDWRTSRLPYATLRGQKNYNPYNIPQWFSWLFQLTDSEEMATCERGLSRCRGWRSGFTSSPNLERHRSRPGWASPRDSGLTPLGPLPSHLANTGSRLGNTDIGIAENTCDESCLIIYMWPNIARK